MKRTSTVAAFSAFTLLFSTGAYAEIGNTKHYKFTNPCKRGPLPRVSIINNPNVKFSRELLEVYPQLTLDKAELIAHQLCGDISIVGDDAALTRRLRLLVDQYGGKRTSRKNQVSSGTKLSTNSVLQLGLFSSERNADKAISAARASGLTSQKSVTKSKNQRLWRVVIKDVSSKSNLRKARKVALNLGIKDAYVVH